MSCFSFSFLSLKFMKYEMKKKILNRLSVPLLVQLPLPLAKLTTFLLIQTKQLLFLFEFYWLSVRGKKRIKRSWSQQNPKCEYKPFSFLRLFELELSPSKKWIDAKVVWRTSMNWRKKKNLEKSFECVNKLSVFYIDSIQMFKWHPS